MPSIEGQHVQGRHARRADPRCTKCVAAVPAEATAPILKPAELFTPDATEVVVAEEATGVIVHPAGIEPDGRLNVKPVKRSYHGHDAIPPAKPARKAPKITAENLSTIFPPVEKPARKVRPTLVVKPKVKVLKGRKVTVIVKPEPTPIPSVMLPAEGEQATWGVTTPEEFTRTGVRSDDLTREQWLLNAVAAMRQDFVDVGREVPELRISIGWPGGRSARLDPLGQCWHPATVGDGIPAVFITPSQDDPVQVLATTRHEMVHASGEMNHRSGFRKLAAQVGFDPQPGASGVSSQYRTPALTAKLTALYEELGPFPHSPVNKGASNAGKPTTQSTRMLKVHCTEPNPEDGGDEPAVCGYTVRTTAKWLALAIPHCPIEDHGEMTVEVK